MQGVEVLKVDAFRVSGAKGKVEGKVYKMMFGLTSCLPTPHVAEGFEK